VKRPHKNDHLRSQEHLRLVRAQPCMISRTMGRGRVAAHHPKELFPAKMGVRISDYLCVPLSHDMHDSLHKANNVSWWAGHRRNPYVWLKWFLRMHYAPGHAGADHALEQVEFYQGRWPDHG